MSQTSFPPPNTALIRAVKNSSRRNGFYRLLRDPVGVLTLVTIATFLILSLLAPWIAPYAPSATSLGNIWASPSNEHILGTDGVGRDVFSRILYGGRTTFAAAAVAAGVAIGIGVPTGLIAGYYGGWFDTASNWIMNMLISLPSIIMLLAVRSALGPSVWISMATLGLLISPSFFRLVRAAVQSVSGELYVDAARASGINDARIIGRHILTAVRAPLIIQGALVAGMAIAVQAGLEFLGIGDQSFITWGMMLNAAFRSFYISPLATLWPALAIVLVTVAFALLGNALRDALEDQEKPPKPHRRSAQVTRSSMADGAPKQNSAPPLESTDQALLTVNDLVVGYQQNDGTVKRVVDRVSFSVNKGEVLGVVGESGSGKTQTAFSILGLLPEDAIVMDGHIVFDGMELVSQEGQTISPAQMNPLRGTRIAYIPQEPMSNLDPSFTIGYQLTRPMIKRLRLSNTAARERALELLTQVGIADPARTMELYPHEISGGMAQRVLIAGAVSAKPDLLIADEPTTALDVTVQAEVLDLIRNLQQQNNMTVILVTHNFGVVADICDRVVVMQQSQMVEQGSVSEVLRHPKQEYTRHLLDSMLEGKPPLTLLLDEERKVAVHERTSVIERRSSER